MAKRFFYVSAALLLLALTYHIGARSAFGQGPGNPPIALANDASQTADFLVVDAAGQAYWTTDAGLTWQRRGNVFGNGPTSVSEQSWGRVKADYRK